MELGAFAEALVRRWYLVVAALALAAGACTYTWSSVGPTYETRASVLLFPPELDAGTKLATGNPYLDLIGLNSARDILIRTLTSQSQRDSLAKAYPDADYALAADSTSSGPIIDVEVSATTAREAVAAQAALLRDIPLALEDLQGGLGLSRQEVITVRAVTVDDRAEAVHKAQLRAAIVATAGVTVLALALIGLVDGLLAARSQARRRRSGDELTAETAAEGVAPGLSDLDSSHDFVEDLEGHSQRVSESAPEPESGTDVGGPARTLNPKPARGPARRAASDEALRTARKEAHEPERIGA